MNAIRRSDLKREKMCHALTFWMLLCMQLCRSLSLAHCWHASILMYASVGAVSRSEVFVLLGIQRRTHAHTHTTIFFSNSMCMIPVCLPANAIFAGHFLFLFVARLLLCGDHTCVTKVKHKMVNQKYDGLTSAKITLQ